MSDDNSNLYLLFQKPLEPLFTPKDDGDTVFSSVPATHKGDRYEDMLHYSPWATAIQNVIGKHEITVPRVNLPDLTFAAVLDRTAEFSLFNETHIAIAGRLTKIFMDADSSSLFTIASYCREIVNIFLFQYALSVALQHRPDTAKNIVVPNIVTLFPNHFVVGSVFPRARKQLALFEEKKRQIIDIIPVHYTATDKELEQRMAYFREDIAVNSHHWHWHTVYPAFTDEDVRKIVDKDRRGELFYYMHNQMLRRYNADRISNDLALVKPLNDFRIAMPEAYFPKLMHSSTNRPFPSRTANCFLSDVHRPKDFAVIEVGELERWRDRIYHAIDQGFVIDRDGKQISLADEKGIDTLGNIIEASALSKNPQLYGNLHNQGHNLISFAHDPEQKFLEGAGVMSEVETAMRDPMFFRWHVFIDNMFAQHKENLPQYDPKKDFAFDDISVTSVDVQMNSETEKKNILKTYWQKSLVVVTNGLDFADIQNSSDVQRFGTCRIFMCPVKDERNNPFAFEAQRKLMIEMDRFKVTLKPGVNTVQRRSDESSVTTEYDKLLEKINKPESSTESEKEDDGQNKFCGCGWPQHLLLPKGTINGASYYIFVIITNYDQDKIDQPEDFRKCDEGSSFCGLKDRKYPDKRPMGFPFDRPYKNAKKDNLPHLIDFVELGKNMKYQKCKIQFCDEVVEVGKELNTVANELKCKTIV